MKAAVWHGVKDIRVEDVELKPLKSDEVVVKVAWAGICAVICMNTSKVRFSFQSIRSMN